MDIFDRYKDLKIAVIGDYCLDEYLWIDAALNEPSLETGLTAYQCVKRETFPGAAGNLAKNLAVLGIGTVYAFGITGDDGRGLELRRELEKLGINYDGLICAADRITSAYTKPWLTENGAVREMSRIDIKNWAITPPLLENAVLEKLEGLAGELDALIIMDQLTEENCGMITDTVRERLAVLAEANPALIVYADSRCRIAKFKNMIIKGNQFEIITGAFGEDTPSAEKIREAIKTLRAKTSKPIIVTLGADGVNIYSDGREIQIPGFPLTGQLDVCGAGDAFSASFVSALAAGADIESAGRIGNTAAAICVTQLGTSGYVTPELILNLL